MSVAKLAISVEEGLIKKIDRLVKKGVFPNRSKAIQVALKEKLDRLERTRLSRECAKLDKTFEQSMAEEFSPGELKEWPQY
jgi:Arc/MetJ-type ribon-helix-helix transcriptional regulator